MTETKIKLTNHDRWMRRLRAMPHNVRIEASRAAETNAKILAEVAQKDAPRLSGDLRVTIRAYPVRSANGAIWRTVAGVKGGKGFWARFVEFGTRLVRAQPFFFPNYRILRPRFRARMGRALKKGARKL